MSPDTGWTKRPTLSAWIYDSTRGAAAGQVRLHRLSRRGAVTVVDAATVTWAHGAHRPRIGYLNTGAPAGGHRGSPLGVLLEMLLPVAVTDGLAEALESMQAKAGSTDAVDALAAELSGTGLSRDFLQQLREALHPDASALLVLSTRADEEQVELVLERGAARGDVREMHAVLAPGGMAVLEGLVARAPAPRRAQ